MKVTALRSIGKINRNVFKNSCRLFSFKFEMTPANRLSSDQSEEHKQTPPAEEAQPKTNFRYNVCQPRTSPIEKNIMAGDAAAIQKQNIKATIEEQHLQPSMLPEYFQQQMEKNVLINPEPDNTEEVRINKTNNQRRFQVSKTCAHAVLPLKSVKLANPFPEPVKVMMSRTVSDDEKAEQMLAESRTQHHSKSSTYRSFSTDVKRWYSNHAGESSSDKCKKFAKAKSTCPKMKLKGCPPVARTTCERHAKQIHCKKQEAPYPAYSEFCHEDIDEKPSECKLCPWKPEENPNFKPQKKKIHTMSPMLVRRSGLEMDLTDHRASAEESSPAYEEELEEEEGTPTPRGMKCDLRKPPCERPKNRRCPPSKEEIKKEEEKKKKKKKKECISAQDILEETIVPTQQVQNLLSLRSTEPKKQDSPDNSHGPCKIRKFKFPCCEPVKRKERQPDGRCPPKKKPPKIRDCPPDEEKKCENLEEVQEYSLSSDSNKQGKDKKKCPKLDFTIYKEEDVDDPCKLKRRGTTKICPNDLLKKKKRKPRKRTSAAVITPTESKTEQPRPTKTIG